MFFIGTLLKIRVGGCLLKVSKTIISFSLQKETLIGHYSDKPHKFNGVKYGGYYELNEIEDVIRYASDRYVTVIQIEMRTCYALSAYPELSCSGGIMKQKQFGVYIKKCFAQEMRIPFILEQFLRGFQ